MSSAEIRITAEPIDNARCKFLVSEPVHEGGVRRFASPDDANGSPLVEAIFAIPGADVAEVIVSGNLVTVVKRSAAPWQAIAYWWLTPPRYLPGPPESGTARR